jgi:hypothetical protein
MANTNKLNIASWQDHAVWATNRMYQQNDQKKIKRFCNMMIKHMRRDGCYQSRDDVSALHKYFSRYAPVAQ